MFCGFFVEENLKGEMRSRMYEPGMDNSSFVPRHRGGGPLANSSFAPTNSS